MLRVHAVVADAVPPFLPSSLCLRRYLFLTGGGGTFLLFFMMQGAACMNNTFCLGVFMFLIYFRSLAWEFSAETVTILAVQVCRYSIRWVFLRFRLLPMWGDTLIYYTIYLIFMTRPSLRGGYQNPNHRRPECLHFYDVRVSDFRTTKSALLF